ncbi:MAG: hypothetical protein WBO09_11310, partial [Methylocystis silviterrae]|uniref:hypothetical protein n=1 Tax=Methylocystis silviterrae TaxID=2743612 RepID=UPI003C73C84A
MEKASGVWIVISARHQFGQEYGHRTGKNPDPDYPFRATPRCRRIANCRLDLDESCACPVNKA